MERGKDEGRQGRRLSAKGGQDQFLFFESERESNRRGKLQISATAKTRITVKEKANKEGGGGKVKTLQGREKKY